MFWQCRILLSLQMQAIAMNLWSYGMPCDWPKPGFLHGTLVQVAHLPKISRHSTAHHKVCKCKSCQWVVKFEISNPTFQTASRDVLAVCTGPVLPQSGSGRTRKTSCFRLRDTQQTCNKKQSIPKMPSAISFTGTCTVSLPGMNPVSLYKIQYINAPPVDPVPTIRKTMHLCRYRPCRCHGAESASKRCQV